MTTTTERVRVLKTPAPASPTPPRRSLRTALVWGAILLGLATAITLAVLAITSDSAPQRIETPAAPTRAGVPMSADAAERLLAGSGAPVGVPRSADAAERWLAGSGAPVGVPRSADGAERWLANNK